MKNITNCRSCRSKKLEPIISLGQQFLSDFVDRPIDKGVAYPLDLFLCQKCFLLQLGSTVPPEKLYHPRYGYKSGISEIIKANLKEIVEEVKNYVWIGQGATVMDTGSNDGELLSNYPTNVTRIAVEPITKLAEESRQHADIVINDFFNNDACKKLQERDIKVDVCTSISMFYDLDSPGEFIKNVKSILADDGVWVIQQNYVSAMVLNNAFCNIVHEHLSFQSLLSLENMLRPYRLEVFHVVLCDINGGSIRTLIAKKGSRQIQDSVISLRETEKQLHLDTKEPYIQFAKRISDISTRINTFITKKVNEGKIIYTIAASTRGNTLLQYCHLDDKLISGAGERNEEKFGKFIASTGIPIVSEIEMRKAKPDYIFVLCWFFKSQILKREKEYLDNGGTLIFPLPIPTLVTKDGEIEIE